MHLEQNAADEYENEDGEDGRSMIDVAKMHAWAIDATTMAVNPRFYIQDPVFIYKTPISYIQVPLFILRHPFITRPLVFNIDDPAFLYTRPPRHTHIYINPLGLI